MVGTLRKSMVVWVAGFVMLFAFAPAASADALCDLTSLTSCSIGTGLFATNEIQPAGTGVIDSFLRVQQNGWEQGYNTDARPIEQDMNSKTDPNFTRSLELTEVSTVTVGTTTYREFFLDVNEEAATGQKKNYITLDQLEIYVTNTELDPNDYRETLNSGQLCVSTQGDNPCKNQIVKIYDMDTAAGGDGYVNLDYLIKGNGSGASDMVFMLDSSLFGSYKYVYLFSQFGNKTAQLGKYASGAGFEEWFVKDGLSGGSGNLTTAPEPGSLVLLGTGLAFAARRWRRNRVVA